MKVKDSRKSIFNLVAKDYDDVRPGYPQKLTKDIISISAIPDGGRILEIGCGTGQATLPFAKRGYFMDCLDIGKELIALAVEKCQKYQGVRFHLASFEEWKKEVDSFDLVISATAFHWIPPEIAYPKAAKALRDSGYIAIFSNIHPTPYSGFFQNVQEVYRSVVPEWKYTGIEPSMEDKIKFTENYINRTGLFKKVLVKRYRWTKKYTANQYIKLLNTFSDHRCLNTKIRKRLFDDISTLIEKKYGGRIIRPYLTILYIAKKVS